MCLVECESTWQASVLCIRPLNLRINVIEKLSHSEAESLAWQFLLAARHVASESGQLGTCLNLNSKTGKVARADSVDQTTWIWLDSEGGWCCKQYLPPICRAAFDLYLPLLRHSTGDEVITAHLGQSIDARIATRSGDSFYVTGEENRKHLHCLRALSDAVIVGSGTVMADDPQLNTRAVVGDSPVRVIMDARARLQAPLKIFSDGLARTILVHQSSANLDGRAMHFGPRVVDRSGHIVSQVERWVVPDTDESLPVGRLVALLKKQGLRRLFVEGGGITVSRFFEARVLDRLHVAVAPLLVGEGTEALQLKGVMEMMHAHRPPHAIYRMGEDILWDFDVSTIKNDLATSVVTGCDTVDRELHDQIPRSPLERLV
ncbi:MAG: RibD family protein [Granulosicoccus sp.]